MSELISEQNLELICRKLSKRDRCLARIYKSYGTPPLWELEQSFSTLVYIILGQQVSLASAKVCFEKLEKRLGLITPEIFITLSDKNLREIGFSRQKSAYCRNVAEALIHRTLDLRGLNKIRDSEVKAILEKIKGIGNWSSSIYLLMAMLRPDIMPEGDLALHTSWKELNRLEKPPKTDEFGKIAARWKPYRSVAARLLWHFYLGGKGKRQPGLKRAVRN